MLTQINDMDCPLPEPKPPMQFVCEPALPNDFCTELCDLKIINILQNGNRKVYQSMIYNTSSDRSRRILQYWRKRYRDRKHSLKYRKKRRR